MDDVQSGGATRTEEEEQCSPHFDLEENLSASTNVAALKKVPEKGTTEDTDLRRYFRGFWGMEVAAGAWVGAILGSLAVGLTGLAPLLFIPTQAAISTTQVEI